MMEVDNTSSPKNDNDLTLPVVGKPEEETDELRDELLPRLSAEDEEELYNRAHSDYIAALEERAEWESRLAIWDKQYYGILPEKDFPWPGASNFNIPLTMLGVETLKPRLDEAILGEDPPIIARLVEGSDKERQERVELFLNWRAKTCLNLAEKVPIASHLFLNPGIVIAKVFWKVDRQKRKFTRVFEAETSPETVLSALFGQVTPVWRSTTGNSWRGHISYTNKPPAKVELKYKVLKDGRLQVLVNQDVVSEYPDIEFIDHLDFIVPSRGASDVQLLPWCQHRQWLFEDQIRRKAESGRFYQDAVDELLKRESPAGDSEQTDSSETLEDRNQIEGITPNVSDVKMEQFPIIEEYRRWDVDGDGFEEEIVFWWTPQLQGRILGWDYRDNLFAHAKRPFVVGKYHPIPFRFYGLSFPEIVRDLQDEINTIRNQRVDFGTLQNLPWYAYRASSTHVPEKFVIQPGMGVALDNPQTDLNVPRFQGSPAFGQAEEALLYQYFERLTGLTDLALGRQPNRVGATRTATGVASLLSEAGLRFKRSMQAFQRFWVEVFEHVLALEQEYLPPGLEFRVTGKTPEVIRLADRAEIAGKFDVLLAATSESLNRQVARNDATVLFQATMNPVLIQAGIVGAKGVRLAFTELLKAFGKPSPEMYLEPAASQIVYSPEEELAIWSSGGDVEPSPMENIPHHIEIHTNQVRDLAVQRAGGAPLLKKIQTHLAKTMGLAQDQMMAQTMMQSRGGIQPSTVGPQAVNAQIGQTAPAAPSSTTTAQSVSKEIA